jgi:hypothetical protein
MVRCEIWCETSVLLWLLEFLSARVLGVLNGESIPHLWSVHRQKGITTPSGGYSINESKFL